MIESDISDELCSATRMCCFKCERDINSSSLLMAATHFCSENTDPERGSSFSSELFMGREGERCTYTHISQCSVF